MAGKMVASLKPGGRMVFVEFRMEDPMVPIKLVHKMSERQVLKEMGEFPGLVHTKTVETLPWQHIIVFTKKKP
jgi:ubiquinone/menaquinone biosynthesis C-methylase UbiE